MSYLPQYTKPYANGYVDRPSKETPERASFINARDDTLIRIEKYLSTLNFDGEYALLTEAGYSLELSIDEYYVLTISLKNKAGTVISSKQIDFPIESMIINVDYNEDTGIITFNLQNGQSLEVNISTLVRGLVADTRTIAGIDLKDDITSEELKVALGVPSKVSDLENDIGYVYASGDAEDTDDILLQGFLPYPKDDNGASLVGTSGQVLISNGDGTTAWGEGGSGGGTTEVGTLKPWLYDTSGEETIIGVYGGKPLYRKYFTIHVKTTNAKDTHAITSYIPEYEAIINHKMYTTSGNLLNAIYADQGTSGTQDWMCYFVNVGADLIVITRSVSQDELDNDFYCIFEYTKTTDAEGSGNSLLPYGVASNASTVYSTEEQAVGKWIDGKTLYQKTIVYENISIDEQSVFLSVNMSIADILFVDNAFAKATDGAVWELPYAHFNSENNIGMFINSDYLGINFRFGTAHVGTTIPYICITLQYTKPE